MRRDLKLPTAKILFGVFYGVKSERHRYQLLPKCSGQRVAKFGTPQQRCDPLRIFDQHLLHCRRERRWNPAITNNVSIDDNHSRPRRIQFLIWAALTCCLNFLRIARASSISVVTLGGPGLAVALWSVARISRLSERWCAWARCLS